MSNHQKIFSPGGSRGGGGEMMEREHIFEGERTPLEKTTC